ncbi:hypothetical protein Btru_036735 [Bulinus truncatus]|nr:hypothetical protein Btru_036735 [Bulinus truncatus]
MENKTVVVKEIHEYLYSRGSQHTGVPRVPEARSQHAGVPRVPEAPSQHAGVPRVPEARSQHTGVPIMPEASSLQTGVPRVPEASSLQTGVPRVPEARSQHTGVPRMPEVRSQHTDVPRMPDARSQHTGFFTVFGFLDLASSLTFMGITFIVIQNPTKMSHLSTFRWGAFLAMVLPQKLVIIILSALPVSPLDYFDQTSSYPLTCFPVRQEGGKGATFGAILFFILWVILAIGFILCVIVAVRFWAGPGTRVHASSPSLWQMQKMEQGRALHKFTMVELGMAVVLTLLLTVLVYSNRDMLSTPQWIGFLTFVTLVIVHIIMAVIQVIMWSSLCCDRTGQKKEPHHRLKQLELIRNEGPGRVRLKASWAAGKGIWKQGLLKVYGPEHIKAWAQEIVVLGLLRKSHSASVLQCLWTSNSNPYHEAMTLISGNVVANDSRLTCLELTSCGTLHDMLKRLDTPLPDQCQRTIMHDVAEGLSYLHGQNVLHRNLTSSAVYLKGSLQSCVLRAAVGDFDDAQIYGTLLTGSPTGTVSRKRFLYPDIRSYSLVGVELLARVCECKLQLRNQPNLHNRNQIWALQSRNNVFTRPSQTTAINIGGVNVSSNTHQDISKHLTKSEARRVHGASGMLDSQENVSNYLSTSLFDKKKKHKNNKSSHVGEMEQPSCGHEIDQNWKLQVHPISQSHCSEKTHPGRRNHTSQVEGFTRQDDSLTKSPRITLVKEASNDSVFHHHDDLSNDIDIVEEHIDHGRIYATKNGEYQQAGYVTSTTDDGREIFIPATFKVKKSSAASSSGYGSCGGSTSVLSEYVPVSVLSEHVPVSVQSEHPSVSEKNISSGVKQVYRSVSPRQPADPEVFDTLPGMTERSKRGEVLLDELLKAKQDAKVEKLLESYEERVKRGDLGVNVPEVPYGVIFPKNNIPTEPTDPNHLQTDQPTQSQDSILLEPNVTSPRPNTSMTQRFQRSGPAGNISSTFWNSRSSFKKTKARTVLKKALNSKEVLAAPQLHSVTQVRGSKAKEIELKYSKIQEKKAHDNSVQKAIIKVEPKVSSPKTNVGTPQTRVEEKTVSKIRSSKSRPAPEPPVGPPLQTLQPLALAIEKPNVNIERVPDFNSYNVSHRTGNESSTTADPRSTETESSTGTSLYSREHTSVEKIESDMNDIINSSSQDPSCKNLPPGMKLIDSGFDSASVSSEESCLCAASALQVVEDGSCSGPSEIFSQSTTTCSCACSNCLGSSQRNQNSSSWTESHDSESWSNSNSFSSYDVNMHRRKLSRRQEKFESPGCVLAPDEQYPSPAHRNLSLRRRGSYRVKRNHRRLAHTKGHYTSSSSDASSSASRRYRELLKKGVEFRVSVIPGSSQWEQQTGRPTAHSQMIETLNIDVVSSVSDGGSDVEQDKEKQNLLSKFTARPCQVMLQHKVQEIEYDEDNSDYVHRLSPIPSLEDIIKEIPDETGKFSDESRAFLNRPDSELSLKALQSVLSPHGPVSEVKGRQPKELMIDKIFHHQGPPSNFGLRGTQDVDESVIREVAMLPSREEVDDTKDVIGLLCGMDGRHIRYCHSISSRISLVRMSDLLPANHQTFEKLVMRLQTSGNLTSIETQILDLMRMCWLNESPPTTAAIIGQLTDSITETEL